MKTLQLSGTENVWIDEENGTIQFWGGELKVEYPIEFALAILDFLKENEDDILATVSHFEMMDRDEGWEGDQEQEAAPAEYDEQEVDLIVGKYEWICPHCEALNEEIELPSDGKLECQECRKVSKVGDYHQAFE
jgi:hypothetical protein